MDINEYRKEFLELAKAVAINTGDGTPASFASVAARNLLDAEIIPDYELCFHSSYSKKRKKPRIDGYAFDEADGTMNILIVDYRGDDVAPILNKAAAEQAFGCVEAFLNEAINGKLQREVEISSKIYFFIETLKNSGLSIRKYRILLITDAVISSRINVLKDGEICNKHLEYQIWDMNRFFKVCGSEGGREPLEVDFTEYCQDGIPCLDASQPGATVKRSFLCVIPGSVLADLYDKYGSRLLEANVRSFLSTKVTVNKNIRNTIREEPNMFFVFNNGIASTATEVKVKETPAGYRLIYANNLQIVNGGQTTASLSTARYKNESRLESILVQMKLTEVDVIKDEKIVQKISKSSNSQSKVSEADFFSAHPFHARMHTISVHIFAPATGGAQHDTHWYYERTKKQYDQEQARMSDAKKKEFRLLNPSDHVIEKTDLAIYRNEWIGLPYTVSLGPQKNIKAFSNTIITAWENNEKDFNDLYYQETVALAIIHLETQKIITKNGFYEKGYRPRFVAYSMAALNYFINNNYRDCELDLKQIWNKQEIPILLAREILSLSEKVYKKITAIDREVQDVAEWCKREDCWKSVKTLDFKFKKEFETLLINLSEKKDIKKEARMERAMMTSIEAQIQVLKLGGKYWDKLMKWGVTRKIFGEADLKLLIAATKMAGTKMPQDWQCQKLLELQERMISEGYQDSQTEAG
jgi:hypothetical protein